MNRVIGVTTLALAVGAVLLTAGCGTTHAVAGASGPSAPVTARSSPPVVPPVVPPGRPTASPVVKPAAERVPSAVTAMTIAAQPGLNVAQQAPAPVTITNPAMVRRVVSLVNGLPVSPLGVYNCPVDTGRAVRLAFRSGASGPVLATVSASMTACMGVAFSVGGKAEPRLAGGGSVARDVLSIAGLHWPGYTGYSGGGVMTQG